jgi:hypothetical protein
VRPTMTELRLFSAKPYDRAAFDRVDSTVERVYLEPRLGVDTAGLAAGAPAICVFVNDDVSAPVIGALAAGGTRCIACGVRASTMSTSPRPHGTTSPSCACPPTPPTPSPSTRSP